MIAQAYLAYHKGDKYFPLARQNVFNPYKMFSILTNFASLASEAYVTSLRGMAR